MPASQYIWNGLAAQISTGSLVLGNTASSTISPHVSEAHSSTGQVEPETPLRESGESKIIQRPKPECPHSHASRCRRKIRTASRQRRESIAAGSLKCGRAGPHQRHTYNPAPKPHQKKHLHHLYPKPQATHDPHLHECDIASEITKVRL